MAGLASTANAEILPGSAAGLGVLAGSAVTNTGNSLVNDGDAGVSPGSAITDLSAAYGHFSGLSADRNRAGRDLGGMTLTSGVYKFDGTAGLTGDLTLSGDGISLYQVGSDLNIAANSSVSTVAGANLHNIYFPVSGAATLKPDGDPEGNILPLQSITAGAGSSIRGSAPAITGAVTMEDHMIPVDAMPKPNSVALTAIMTAILAGILFRRLGKAVV